MVRYYHSIPCFATPWVPFLGRQRWHQAAPGSCSNNPPLSLYQIAFYPYFLLGHAQSNEKVLHHFRWSFRISLRHFLLWNSRDENQLRFKPGYSSIRRSEAFSTTSSVLPSKNMGNSYTLLFHINFFLKSMPLIRSWILIPNNLNPHMSPLFHQVTGDRRILQLLLALYRILIFFRPPRHWVSLSCNFDRFPDSSKRSPCLARSPRIRYPRKCPIKLVCVDLHEPYS